MSCFVCNQTTESGESFKTCTSCQTLIHLSCLPDNCLCSHCSQPLLFTLEEFRQIDESSDTDSDELEDAMSNLLDQSQIPDMLRNKRIEHKIICVGPTGTPQITIITIPRKMANLYLDKLFMGVTPLDRQNSVEAVSGIIEPLSTDLYSM